MSAHKAESDVQKARRERGVVAQREYRKRLASKTQTLQEENDKLRAAVEAISSALSQHGVSSRELVGAIHAARDVVGIDSPDVIALPIEAAEDKAPGAQAQSRGAEGDHDVAEATRIESNTRPQVGSLASSSTANAGALSSASAPPVGTFAWCIYWRSLYYHVPFFDYQGCAPRGTVVENAARVDMAMQLWIPLGKDDMFYRLWQRRLRKEGSGYKQKKVLMKDSNANLPLDDLKQLTRRAYADIGLRGLLRPATAFESILWAVFSGEEKERFQAVLDGSGKDKDVELLLELVETAAQNYFCVGEGPRWSSIWAHMATGAWIDKMRNSGDEIKML